MYHIITTQQDVTYKNTDTSLNLKKKIMENRFLS
jgi:hypothetical protein